MPPVPAAVDTRPLDATTNILVLGSDRRPDTPNWRTDVMMIIAMDQEHGRAGVISCPGCLRGRHPQPSAQSHECDRLPRRAG
ncbi:MAG: hypothetical protein R2851_09270 [Caldilineaceae bacterium]